jgi:NIPSNAP protein
MGGGRPASTKAPRCFLLSDGLASALGSTGERLTQLSRSVAMAFYELRQYVILPGKMEAWLKCMEEEIIPFQVAKGMVITGSYRGEKDDSVYVWMRRFESEAERERQYKAVYESDHWKNVISPKVGELIDRSKINVQRIVPTPLSVAH